MHFGWMKLCASVQKKAGNIHVLIKSSNRQWLGLNRIQHEIAIEWLNGFIGLVWLGVYQFSLSLYRFNGLKLQVKLFKLFKKLKCEILNFDLTPKPKPNCSFNGLMAIKVWKSLKLFGLSLSFL